MLFIHIPVAWDNDEKNDGDWSSERMQSLKN